MGFLFEKTAMYLLVNRLLRSTFNRYYCLMWCRKYDGCWVCIIYISIVLIGNTGYQDSMEIQKWITYSCYYYYVDFHPLNHCSSSIIFKLQFKFISLLIKKTVSTLLCSFNNSNKIKYLFIYCYILTTIF